MLDNDKYELLKESLLESQRLFNKLAIVAKEVEEFEYDESGLYREEEEKHQRHWRKLSSKIVDNMGGKLPEFTIELLENKTLDIKELKFNLKSEESISKIVVKFSQDDSITVSQIS